MTHWDSIEETEAQSQSAFVAWCDLNKIACFSIPNGGSRNKIEAVNLKRQGVKAGVPDLFIPTPMMGYHGLFIEMKTRSGVVRKEQREWIGLLRNNHYRVEVCRSQDEAKRITQEYLKG